jgi:hypothetical protein
MVFSKSALEFGIWTVLSWPLFLTVQTASSQLDYSYCLITKAKRIGHILRRIWILKPYIEGKIKVKGKRGRKRKRLLDDMKETTRYCKLKYGAVDHTLWRIRFGRGCGPVVKTASKRWKLVWFRCNSRHRSWHTTDTCARFDTNCDNKLHQQAIGHFIKILPKKNWHRYVILCEKHRLPLPVGSFISLT